MDIPDQQPPAHQAPQPGIPNLPVADGLNNPLTRDFPIRNNFQRCRVSRRIFRLRRCQHTLCKANPARPPLPPPCFPGIKAMLAGNMRQSANPDLLEPVLVLPGIFPVAFLRRPRMQHLAALRHRQHRPDSRRNAQPCFIIWPRRDKAKHFSHIRRGRFNRWPPLVSRFPLIDAGQRQRLGIMLRDLGSRIMRHEAQPKRILRAGIQLQPVNLKKILLSRKPRIPVPFRIDSNHSLDAITGRPDKDRAHMLVSNQCLPNIPHSLIAAKVPVVLQIEVSL